MVSIGKMNDENGIAKLKKAVKKDKSILILLLILIAAIAYGTFYLTGILTNTITVTTFIFGFRVIKKIFCDHEKMKVFLCIVALEFALYLYITMNKSDYKSKLVEITPDIHTPAPVGQNQCGSARWQKKKERDRVFKSQILPEDILQGDIRQFEIPSGGFVLGKEDTKEGEKIYYIDTDTHVLCVGATRSGKTRCCVLETIGLQALAGESIIATDPKGELVDFTKPYLERLGYEVYTLNYDEPVYSDCYNYLQIIIDYVDAGDIPAAIDATWDLTSQLVGEAKGEKIWNDGEASMIAAAIMAVVYDNQEPKLRQYRNLPNVYYFLVNMCKPVTLGKRQVLPLSIYVETLPEEHPSKGLLGVSDIAPSKTRSSFYTSAVMTLKLFTNPYIANMSSKTSFNLEDLGKKKMAVFIVLPEDRLTYHPLATLFVAQAYAALSKSAKRNGGRLNRRVNIDADEFGNFSKLSNLIQILTMGGGKGIRLNFFVQDFAQLEEKYEKTGLRTIRSNCETWVYIKSNDPETRKDISDSLGKYTTQSYSTSVNSNRSSTSVTSTGSSNQLIGRELLTPEEVKEIKRPYTLVIPVGPPAIMYAPDLSQWYFNELFGMGDEEHNKKLRVERQENRLRHSISQKIELWGIWDVIVNIMKQKQKAKEAQMAAEAMQKEMMDQMQDDFDDMYDDMYDD